jgi:pimeloyl-ACP methyl ester carboxylesterase
VSGYNYQPDHSENALHELELFNHADELWERKEFDDLADLEVHVWADGPLQPAGRAPAQIREYIRKIVRANYTRPDGEVTPIPLDPLAVNRLGEIHVPTLVMVGEFDTVSTRAIPGAAHLLPMEQSAKFNEVVLNFLRTEIKHDFIPPSHL